MKAKIRENMNVVGVDGGHLGTVDCIAGDFIKLKRRDSGPGNRKQDHHYIGLNLVNDIEGQKVQLCCDAEIVTVFEE